jgi:hypothetical protein
MYFEEASMFRGHPRSFCMGYFHGCFIGKPIEAWKFMRLTIDIMGADQFWATYLLRATV